MLMVLAFMGLAVPLLTASLGLAGTLSRDSRIKTDILTDQYSTQGVREYIQYLLMDLQAWEDFLDSGGQGDITVNGEVVGFTVTENPPIYTPGGPIEIKEDAVLEGSLISGNSRVEVKENVVLEGGIRAGGDVDVKEDALVQGDIISGGDVVIGKNARVEGDITAAGTVELKTGASVTGMIYEYTAVMPIIPAEYTGPAVLAAGETEVTVNADQSLMLDPGSYRKLEVKENATLELRSGQYSFTQVEIKESGVVRFDLSGDPIIPIIIDLVKDLEVKENVQMQVLPGFGSAADVWFRVQEKIELKEEGQFLGVYLTLRQRDVYGVTITNPDGGSVGSFSFIQ